jgi:serine/threonine protein kinase
MSNGIPEPAVAKIVESVLKGLIFLKEKLNVMHRDVRPSNILIDSKGHVKVMFFFFLINLFSLLIFFSFFSAIN